MTRGIVDSVKRVQAGSVLASTLTIGDTTLDVLAVDDFDPEGSVTVLGSTFAYDSIDGNTLTLHAGSPVGGPADFTRVDIPGEVVRVAQWRRIGQLTYQPAYLRHPMKVEKALQAEASGLGVLCELEQDTQGDWWVKDVLDREPRILSSFADPDDPITPGAVTTSLDLMPEQFAGKVPPSAFGAGLAASAVEFTNLKAGPFRAGSDGYQFTDPNGAVVSSAGPDGVRTGGVIDATSARVSGRSELFGMDVPAGGDITLHTDVQPPGVAPNGTQDWVETDIGFPAAMVPQNRHSFAVEDLTHAYCLRLPIDSPPTLVKFDPTGGGFTGQTGFKGSPTLAVVVSGGYSSQADLWVNLEYDGAWKVRYYSTGSATFDHEWTATVLGTVPTPRPALSVHSTGGHEYVTLSQSNPDGTIAMNRFTDEAFTSTVTTADVFGFGDLESGTHQGDVVYLTGQMNVSFPGGLPSPPSEVGLYPGMAVAAVLNFGPFFGTPGTVAGWLPIAYGDPAGALAIWDGDSTNRTFYLSRFSNVVYQAGDVFRNGTQCLRVTGYDTGTGDETEPGPDFFLDYIPGKRITFTMSPPDGAPYDEYRCYLGAAPGGTYPGDASMWLQGTTTQGVLQVPNIAVAGTNLTASRVAPTPPGLLGVLAGDGTVLLAGDHTGEIYDLIAAGGGGGGTGGIDIDCGNASASGVEIDCGGA